jgi:tRNA A-37 threonylcarbamoyl transferase component Bud32
MQCPKCKQILAEGVRFCPHDGTPLTETGATLPDATPTGGRRPASKELELPVVVGNRYQLEALRGGGGMAKVYRATDLTLDREVAVKLINPDLRNETEFDERFKREALVASKLTDPYIVVVHDYGLDAKLGPYLVMEYLDGQSLRERLSTAGPLPLKAALQLAGQLLLALIHAHGKSVVHRDIKPDNIFVLNQSNVRLHVRVLDFGIARIYGGDEGGQANTLTTPGAVIGTPRYMSPEQLAGQPLDVRSDLYSAAVVIHEALTGQMPYFQGKKLCELCPEATPALQELLDQCLKPNPAERPPTAVEVYLRLQELGKASGILLLPPGAMDRLVAARKAGEPTVQYRPPEDAKSRLKRRLLIAAAAILLILGVTVAVKAIQFFNAPVKYDGPETLHGVALEDSQDDIGDHLALRKFYVGNPWTLKETKGHLGHILKKEDLRLKDSEVGSLVVQRTADDKVSVLFHQGKVIAVVSRDPYATTAHGLRIGSKVDPMYERYPEGGQSHDEVLPDGTHVEVRRYPALGIGFELQHGRIIGMTLYPKVKEGGTSP